MGCRDTHIQHAQLSDFLGRIGTLDHQMLGSPACGCSKSSLTDDIVDCCQNGVWVVLVIGLLQIRHSLSACLALEICEDTALDYLSHIDRVYLYLARGCRR